MTTWSHCDIAKSTVVKKKKEDLYIPVLRNLWNSEYFRRGLYTSVHYWKISSRGSKFNVTSLVPRPSTPPVFDRLQYAKMEGKSLGNFITWSRHDRQMSSRPSQQPSDIQDRSYILSLSVPAIKMGQALAESYTEHMKHTPAKASFPGHLLLPLCFTGRTSSLLELVSVL